MDERLVTIHEVSYYNMILGTNHVAKTDNAAVLKQFLAQLARSACIMTISGKTETIRTYMGPKPDPSYDMDALKLHTSTIVEKDGSSISLWLTPAMVDAAEQYVHGEISYEVAEIPVSLDPFLKFTKGWFKDSFKDIILTAYRVFIDSDDSCLDVIKTITRVNELFAIAPSHRTTYGEGECVMARDYDLYDSLV